MEPRIEIQTSLSGFFDAMVREALASERLTLQEPTTSYLVQLVTEYAERDALYAHGERDERGTPALATLYARAVEAPPHGRFNAYRQLGDNALVVAGLFAPHVERRKVVDLRYYADMGAAAYHHAAQLSRDGFAAILGQLSTGFGRVVEALTRFAEKTTLPVRRDVGAMFDRYGLAPESEELRRRLLNLGLVPVSGPSKAA